MSQLPGAPVDPNRARALEAGLIALIERFGGGAGPALAARTRQSVEQLAVALSESSRDGASLSPLMVVQIRLGKFAASRLPPALYQAPEQLAALRAGLRGLALAYLGEQER